MYRGVYRVGSAHCDVKKAYIFNKRWVPVKGHQYFQDGRVQFDDDFCPKIYHNGNSLDSLYRQFHQTHFASNAVVWARTNNNISMALGRLLSLRFADPGKLEEAVRIGARLFNFQDPNDPFLVEQEYRDAQHRWMCNPDSSRSDAIKEWIGNGVDHDYTTMIYEALCHHQDKHPKKELRIKAWEELVESGQLGAPLWVRSVLYKMKTEELAKPGKWPRMIGDLGVGASLQGFRATNYLKLAMARRPLVYKDFEIEFVKAPTYEKLVEVFEKLMCPPRAGYMALFSDDSCASVRLPDGRIVYGNLDISGCDGSHTGAIFKQMYYVTPSTIKPTIQTLIKQCKLPIKIVNVHNIKQKVKLKNTSEDPVLYSGSTVTTVINNLANINIGISIADDLQAGKIRVFDDLMTSAAKVGYIVTCEEATCPEDIQFLKHSPAYDIEGNLRPLLNVGVLLRSSGTSKGDLPGRKSESIEDRASSFQKSVLQGMYPGATFSILNSLRKHCSGSTVTRSAFISKHLPYDHYSGSPSYHIDDASLARRYGLPVALIEELNHLIQDSGFGYQIQSKAVDAILKKDYGLRSEV